MSAPIYSVSEWKSSRFDMIIDVRASEEFQIDHIPSAVNMPVLTDTQRAEVGTIYKQVSPLRQESWVLHTYRTIFQFILKMGCWKKVRTLCLSFIVGEAAKDLGRLTEY